MANDEKTGTREKPINREPRPQDLLDNFLTPTDVHPYERNHGPVPTNLSASAHTITIEIHHPSASSHEQPTTKTLTAVDLATKFPQHCVIAALQCAGNRRHAMRTRLKETQGIDWFDGAILNAEWEGPLVSDVLKWAGVDWIDVKKGKEEYGQTGGDGKDGEMHAAFACCQQKTQEDEWYGGSIPLRRAMNKEMEAVLALKMNGEILSLSHGYPVRALIPGIIGARSVKWLDSITVSHQPSQNFYQNHDYKVLPPDATSPSVAEEKDYWSKVPPMMDNLINSVIGDPEDDETVRRDENGKMKCRGYAIPGGDGGPVVKVEVSGDEGTTWVEAKLGRDGGKWSWRLWECEVEVKEGEGRRLFSKATDSKENVQMEEKSQWNLRGVGYNGYESTVNLKVL